uniref:Uncharacterized protein n=1 Tax=Rhizophagus irregularis (strain DAOM 181602 / DAOM 197198 / MUCL 43194) TaxID=747089 RepID=U9SZX7_RHIID
MILIIVSLIGLNFSLNLRNVDKNKTSPIYKVYRIGLGIHFGENYVNMNASQKSDQQLLLNLTIKNLTLFIIHM